MSKSFYVSLAPSQKFPVSQSTLDAVEFGVPTLLDPPSESDELLRRVVSGMRQAPLPVGAPDAVQLGEWLGFLKLLKAVHQWFAEQDQAAPAAVRAAGLLRGTTHHLLAGGEYLLNGFALGEKERALVEANVRFLRDSLVLDFSEATSEQTERGLTAIFGATA